MKSHCRTLRAAQAKELMRAAGDLNGWFTPIPGAAPAVVAPQRRGPGGPRTKIRAMQEAGARAGWRAWVGRAAAFALGVILLVATAAKAMDPAAFAEMLRSDHLTFGLPAMLVALLALGVEAAVGLALVLGIRR